MRILTSKIARYSTDAYAKRTLKMPDLSDPKWQRREKLNPINFANKGKSGRNKVSLKLKPMEKPKEAEEQLPESKTSLEKVKDADIRYAQVYQSLKNVDKPQQQHDKQAKIGERLMEQIRQLPVIGESTTVKQISDEVKAELRDKLKASGNNPGLVPAPKNSLSTQLSPLLDKALVEKVKNEASSPLTQYIASKIVRETDPFSPIAHKDWSTVVELNSRLGRFKQAHEAFDLLVRDGHKPFSYDYVNLMDAYANGNQLKACLDVFVKFKATEPPAESLPLAFGVLIKCFVKNSRVHDAFRLYEEMKLMKVPITQPILTTLIKGCSSVGDYNRAWRLFEHMKSEVCRPDELTFNHMLHICAKTGHVERATVLFNEMLQAKNEDGLPIIPLESTFNTLVHAYAKRREYYRQTFEIVEQMKEAGYKPELRTFNYMIMATAQQGDVIRAQSLWKEMKQSFKPNEHSFTLMLAAYSRVPNLLTRLNDEAETRIAVAEFQKKVMSAKMGLDNELRMKDGQRPIDINEWAMEASYDPDLPFEFPEPKGTEQFEKVRQYLLEGKNEEQKLLEWRQEAEQVFNEALSMAGISDKEGLVTNDEKLKLSPDLMSAYIDVLGSFQEKRKLFEIYENMQAKFKVTPNERVFCRAIYEIFRIKTPIQDEDEIAWMLTSAWRIFEDYEKYRSSKGFPERWEELETKYIRNQWQTKGITHEQRKNEYFLYRRMISELTRYNRVQDAAKLLAKLLQRGHGRIAAQWLVKHDKYQPLENTEKPRHFIRTRDNKLNPVEKAAETWTNEDSISNVTTELLNIVNEREEKNDPHYVSYGGRGFFDPNDFRILITKARDLGANDIAANVDTMLTKASYVLDKKQQKSLERIQQIDRRLRNHWRTRSYLRE